MSGTLVCQHAVIPENLPENLVMNICVAKARNEVVPDGSTDEDGVEDIKRPRREVNYTA